FRRVWGLPAAALLLSVATASGQAPDSVATPELTSDSASVERMPRPVTGPPIDVGAYSDGVPSDSTPLVRLFSSDPVELLDRMPASFRISLGNLGWPDAIALYGVSPGAVGLTLDGLPVHDPVTGRPLFEALPGDLLAFPALFGGRHSSAAGASFATRRFDVERPHTELRYRVGAPGYQSISATHVQQRRVGLIGTPAVLQVLFRFASSGWDGGYPNSFSDLTQVDGRVGLHTANWALRVIGFVTRRHGGAHGGVAVRGNDFDSIYTTFNAAVDQPSATFRMKRSDLRVAFDRVLSSNLKPLSVQFSWVSHVRRYRNQTATEALVHEYSVAAVQQLPAPLPSQYIAARLITRFDDVRSDSIFADRADLSRSSLEMLLESETRVGNFTVTGDAGLVQSDGHTIPELRAGVVTSWSGLDVSSELSVAGRVPSRLETAGSDHVGTIPSGDLNPEMVERLAFALEKPFGTSRIRLEAFAVSTGDPFEIWSVAPDSFAVIQGSEGITRYGLDGRVGWREVAERGLYSDLQATFEAADAADGDPFLTALDESVPSFRAGIRIGTRYLLFAGDLDLDLYVLGRYWSSFRSRVYDPVTGLLALGNGGTRTIGNSGTLDVRVAAGIRSATLFVGFENVLAGTSYPGAVLVAPYPLTARAVRFGVFWPIDN
ncbi:MAG TPA: putative porin, partial [Rhodothermales bacterium]